ncbi:unnamed protein product [Sympodiomycopsis kandeliae]
MQAIQTTIGEILSYQTSLQDENRKRDDHKEHQSKIEIATGDKHGDSSLYLQREQHLHALGLQHPASKNSLATDPTALQEKHAISNKTTDHMIQVSTTTTNFFQMQRTLAETAPELYKSARELHKDIEDIKTAIMHRQTQVQAIREFEAKADPQSSKEATQGQGEGFEFASKKPKQES